MSCSNAIYYKPCTRCKRPYSVRYFDRHDCDSNRKMKQLQVDVDNTNGEFDNNAKESEISHLDEPAEYQETVDDTPLLNSNFTNHETGGFVDDSNDEVMIKFQMIIFLRNFFNRLFLLRKIYFLKTMIVVYQIWFVGYACEQYYGRRSLISQTEQQRFQ